MVFDQSLTTLTQTLGAAATTILPTTTSVCPVCGRPLHSPRVFLAAWIIAPFKI